ncbi:MerR family transcriptional regulator [Streptomyces sp. NPDC050610]|uniref:DNA polymerase III subunit beta family protein n=1 Tax=Streptomyces sp. NPDC050610 TaxID=3157097 RepID=UPI00342D66DD
MDDMDDVDHMGDTDDNRDTPPLLSIGTFARSVGLAPSALRFYDDCDVLRPARVDEASGYRHYARAQRPRAVALRRLRAAGLPLAEVTAVLDGEPEEARRVLHGHLLRTRDLAEATRAAVEEILHALPGGGGRAAAVVGGPELASALRQVAPAVARGAAREEFPVLGNVLIELDGQEVRLVATDRYRLAVRVLPGRSTAGGPGRALVGADQLAEIGAWALSGTDVRIEVDGGRVALRADDGPRRCLPGADGAFPSYRTMLDALAPVRTRVITDRSALRAALDGRHGEGVVRVRVQEREIALGQGDFGQSDLGQGDFGQGDFGQSDLEQGGSPPAALRAVCTGPPQDLAFDPAVLLPALEASVGPDVLLEIASAAEPVVVRSADQGSFTTLVMPVHGAPGGDVGRGRRP